MIKFDEHGHMGLISIFPGIVTFWVSLPFDQILQGLAPPPGPVGMYLLHFIFLFSFNQIWGRSGEVWSMCLCFGVGCDQTSVEDWMDAPLGQEFELHRYGGDDPSDFEWSVMSWR